MVSSDSFLLDVLSVLLGGGMWILLITVIIYPLIFKWKDYSTELHPPFEAIEDLNLMKFNKIAVALDFSDSDVKALQYAMNIANEKTVITLIHIVESVSARISNENPGDYEARKDEERLQQYVDLVQNKGFTAQYELGYKNRILEIARIINETESELLVLGSHGHRSFMDFVYGETISKIHHVVKVPVFIAK
jgi:manganese transport protein